MVNLDGANIVLGTSFGYFTPFMVDLAKKYPKVEFRHAAPLWDGSKHPKNLGSYFGYLNQAHYVNGVAAGLSDQVEQARFRRRQADLVGAVEHQLLPARRPAR